ncbi:MAG: glycosyltransferase family 2 protein [Motiliproteus sp.]
MAESALSDSMRFRPAVLIPVFDHQDAIISTLEDLLYYDIPVLLVDDGSSNECRDVLITLSNKYAEQVTLVRLDKNGGKGAAVKAGLRALLTRGYSHAIQIDADGQHDLSDLMTFVDTAKKRPDALVTGYPKYDASVPKLRYYSRYLTHIWVWINTLSFDIRDAMCGFRVYPLASILDVLERNPCGNRMDFDPEVIVRWSWHGGSVINLPTQVQYPIDGVSHFNLWLDNMLISKMHTRLFFGMLMRLHKIIWRKINV